MATASPLSILKMPARLVVAPTDLSAAFPYGGRALGLARDLEFVFGSRFHHVHAEEWGATTNTIYCGDRGLLKAVLRGWDLDAVDEVFPGYVLGRSGQPAVADLDAPRAGSQITGSVILAAPLAPEAYPAVLLYNAMVHPDETAALRYSRKVEAGIAVVWEAAPDATKRRYAVERLEDMTL